MRTPIASSTFKWMTRGACSTSTRHPITTRSYVSPRNRKVYTLRHEEAAGARHCVCVDVRVMHADVCPFYGPLGNLYRGHRELGAVKGTVSCAPAQAPGTAPPWLSCPCALRRQART